MANRKIRKRILFISFLLLPITLNFFSPVLIIMGSFEKIVSGALIVWSMFFITSLFIGRAGCGYICPYGGLQMVTDKVITKDLKNINWLRKLRYILGMGWVIIILYAIISAKGFEEINFFYLTENFVSVDNVAKLIFYYVIVIALLILPLTLGKRAACHYICPMSLLNIIGTKIKNRFKYPSLHLESSPNNCVKCSKCTKACPMSLNVVDMVESSHMKHTECILCGECVTACKFSAIKRTFKYDKMPTFKYNK